MTLAIVVALLAVLGNVLAEVPSYIHVCGRQNPELSRCISESAGALRPLLRRGIPELDVPVGEPMDLGLVHLLDSPTLHVTGENVQIYGVTDFNVTDVNVDFEKMVTQFKVYYEHLDLSALYDINVRILVPISSKGVIQIRVHDMTAHVVMKWTLVDRKGKRYMYFPSVTSNLSIRDFTSSLENANTTILMAVNQALGSSHQEVLATFTPPLERVLSEKTLFYANAIVRHFPFDELFPDRP